MSRDREVSIISVKRELRDIIKMRYGTATNFINSEEGQKLGGSRVRTYLYDRGTTNIDFLNRLRKLFGMPSIRREIKVVKSVTYFINEE